MSKFKKNDIEWNGTSFTFKPGVWQELKKVFSDKDVEYETTKAQRWLSFNPAKKDYTRFLCNWLNRADRKKNTAVDETPRYSGARTANEPRDMRGLMADILDKQQRENNGN